MNQPNQYDVVLGGRNSQPLSGSAVMGITNRYFHPEHRQFCLDMAAAQLPVSHYDGRFFWSGPSAIVGDLQDVLGATKVKCVWDELDSRFAVYPRAYSHEAIALMRSLDEADSQHLLFRAGKKATIQKAGRELLENYPFRIGLKGGNFKTYYSGGCFITKYVH